MSVSPRSGFHLAPARGPDATDAAGQTAERCGEQRAPAVESRTCLCGHRARASAGKVLRTESHNSLDELRNRIRPIDDQALASEAAAYPPILDYF